MNTNSLSTSISNDQVSTTEEVEIFVVMHHNVYIKPGKDLLVSFRVQPGKIPAWFPRRGNWQSASDAGENGRQIMFDISPDETPVTRSEIHSVRHECEHFGSQFFLANAYWDMIQTQKGPRPVLYFWFHKEDANLNPNREFLARSHVLFQTTADQTWDYVNAYENPENVVIVYKGGSQKRARHFVCCEK